MAQSEYLYQLIRSRRRTIALIIKADNQLVVRCGLKTPLVQIDQFIASKQGWIARKQHENRSLIHLNPGEGPHYNQLRQDTAKRVFQIILHYPDFCPAKVTIRKQRRRWGSCSRKGQLSINTSAGLLPQELLEYIVLHELCHLRHFDHSFSFYQLLIQQMPDARERQKALKKYHVV